MHDTWFVLTKYLEMGVFHATPSWRQWREVSKFIARSGIFISSLNEHVQHKYNGRSFRAVKEPMILGRIKFLFCLTAKR